MSRLLRWIWRLYPRRWRERFGAELERDLREAGRVRMRNQLHESEPEGRKAVDAWLVWDALRTLPRAWATQIAPVSFATSVTVDLRSSWRSLIRAPGYAVLVILTLALALGVNSAVFSVSWAVILKELPYTAPEQIVLVRPSPAAPRADGGWALEDGFLDGPGVQAAALYVPDGGANLESPTGALRLQVTQVDTTFFPLLGMQPLLGRWIASADPGAPEAVLSQALWERTFGGDPSVVGALLSLSGHSLRVVGVAPPGAQFPSGTDLWMSMPPMPDFYAMASSPSVLARLTSLDVIPALEERHRAKIALTWAGLPDYIPQPPVRITPLREELTGPVRGPLLALLGASAAVLLLGCVNLAGIQIARLLRRSGELELRRALGAGRARLFTQLVLEVALLAGVAGITALAVAWGARRTLAALLPGGVPGLDRVGLAPPVLVFTALATVGAAFLVGTLPAWRAVRWSGFGTGRSVTVHRSRARLQATLLISQVALAIVLAVGAGLMGRSLLQFTAIPLGYDLDSVLTFRAFLPSGSYPDEEAQHAWVRRVQEDLRTLPGITAVGFANRLPFSRGVAIGLALRPEDAPPERQPVSMSWVRASPGYFEAMGIRFLAGGPPTASTDVEGDLGGIVLGRAAALRLFGDDAPLGKRVVVDGGSGISAPVVGVVEDVRLRGREEELHPAAFGPVEGASFDSPAFALRFQGDLDPVVAGLRRVLVEVDASIPPADISTTAQAAAGELATRRALAGLALLFGAAAQLLLALGLHGLVVQWVQTRRRELGLRIALGAARHRVVLRTVGRALALVASGVVVGVPCALALTRGVRALIYGIAPWDPTVVVFAVTVVLGVGALAALRPALRAGQIAPAESLRAD